MLAKIVKIAMPTNHTALRVLSAAVAGLLFFAAPAAAGLGDCGQPVTTGVSPTASDALYALRAAVGISPCDAAVCDIDGSCTVTAGDALLLLAYATGSDVELACDLCGAGSTTTTSTTTTTLPAATWNEVQTILVDAGCAVSGCHGNGSSAGALGGLDNYNTGYNSLVLAGVACNGSSYQVLVDPGFPLASFLLAKVDDTHDCGTFMPIVGQDLSPSEVEAIRSWIESGAPKN